LDKKKKELDKRDSKGRFKKGHKSTGGRKKGEVRDIICKDGRRRNAGDLVTDLLATYGKLGSDKFLLEWAKRSHRNLERFLDLLFKFAPMPTVESTMDFKPLVVRVITDKRPGELEASPQFQHTLENQVRELRQSIIDRDNELRRFKALFETHGIDAGVIEHEPIREKLPEHKPDETEEEREEREELEEEENYKDETDRVK